MPCKKRESQDNLQTTNPAILQLEPRPGGLIMLKEEKDCKCKKKKSAGSVSSARSSRINTARELMIQQGVTDLDWTTTAIDKEYDTIGLYNPFNDSVSMLSIVISTVLLMATDSKIPCVHVDLTQKYLNCIRDEYGNHPPNVQGILNHIRYLMGEREEKPKSKKSLSCKSSKSSQNSKGSQSSKGSDTSKSSTGSKKGKK